MAFRTSAIVVLFALGLVAPASAATLSVDGDTLRYDAAEGELNHVNLELQPPSGYTLQDQGTTAMTVIAPCTVWNLDRGLGAGGICPPGGIERAVARLGDQHDWWFTGGISHLPIPVRLLGAEGNDRLVGSPLSDTIVAGSGNDDVDGGAGNDTLFTYDGEVDTLRCGDGVDGYVADRLDQVDPDCETALGGVPSRIDQAPDVRVIRVGGRSHRLRQVLGAGVPVWVDCAHACSVDARLRLRRPAAQRKRLMAGSRTSSLSAGGHVVVVRLNRAARRYLRYRQAATLAMQVSVSVPDDSADGAESSFTRRLRVVR